MALDPQFTSGRPFVYVLYAHDAAIGGTAPRWGDQCPSPPGATGDGCVDQRPALEADAAAVEQVLIEDWCQQYPSHSVGEPRSSAPTARSTSAPATARASTSPTTARTAARSTPAAIRPGGVGATLTPPTAEGGALRSQDITHRLRPDEPRRDDHPRQPGHGRRAARQPERRQLRRERPPHRRAPACATRSASPSARARTTSTLGDVGWNTWEEINRVPNPAAPVENFGWPCYEGTAADVLATTTST